MKALNIKKIDLIALLGERTITSRFQISMNIKYQSIDFMSASQLDKERHLSLKHKKLIKATNKCLY